MDTIRLVAIAAGGGVVLTLLTGLVPVRSLLGGTHYGLPAVWLVRLVLGPGCVPWRVRWLGFVVDVVVWSVVVAVILVLYGRYRRG